MNCQWYILYRNQKPSGNIHQKKERIDLRKSLRDENPVTKQNPAGRLEEAFEVERQKESFQQPAERHHKPLKPSSRANLKTRYRKNIKQAAGMLPESRDADSSLRHCHS
jgi:hypothetical protein